MNSNYYILIYLFCFLNFHPNSLNAAPVLIVTHAFNKPEYIPWQYFTLMKFIRDDYEFIVFNDPPNQEIGIETARICGELNIPCIEIPQKIHDYHDPYLKGPEPRHSFGDPSAECAETIQYMMDTLGFDYPGNVVILDSDMFPIREMSINSMMENYDVMSHPQFRMSQEGKIEYFLPNLLALNMETLQDKYTLNFNIGIINGVNVDTAGCTYYYIQSHPELRWQRSNCEYYIDSDEFPEIFNHFKTYPAMLKIMTEKEYDFEFYADYSFIHFRAGSNWYNSENFAAKKECFFNALMSILGKK